MAVRREKFMVFKESKLRKLRCFTGVTGRFFSKKGGPIQGLNGPAQK